MKSALKVIWTGYFGDVSVIQLVSSNKTNLVLLVH